MEEQRAYTVIESAQHPLGLAILLARVWTGKAESGAVGGEERANSSAVELLAIVCLKSEDGALKLCLNIGVEFSKNRKNIRLVTQGKGPNIMIATVEYNQIVQKTRHTSHRRCPNI